MSAGLPPMTPDEREAGSIRYGNSGLLIVPLSSGRWAIFDRWGKELQGYVEFPQDISAELLKISSKSVKLHKRVSRQVAPTSTASPLSADDLGL